MASFSAGTTFTDGVANDVTAAKLGALVNNATPTSGFIQDRTAETITATNDTLLIGDASDSNALKRITVANFAQTLPTAKITTGTIETGTFGTTTSTAASVTTGTITTLTAGTTTSTAATITTGTIPTLVATTLITSGTGTAAAPAIVPTGDTNTGVFFPAADTTAFSTQGTERVRIDSSGNVGIGKASPETKLHVVGEIKSERIGIPTQNGKITFENGNYEFDSSATLNYVFKTNGTERLRIDSSGNVGIGTNSPSSKLQISGGDDILRLVATSPYLSFYNGATRIGYIRADNTDKRFAIVSEDATTPLVISTNDSERLRIDSSGNVGIGTTSPLTKLDVRGVGYVSQLNLNYGIGSDGNAIINGGTNLYLRPQSGALICDTSGTERLRIDSSGFVSIGTATALSALHVHGNVTLSNTTTATSAGTGGISKPATYAGYLTVSINGTSRKIPYYAT